MYLCINGGKFLMLFLEFNLYFQLCLFMVDILNNKLTMFVSFSLPSDGIAVSNTGQAIAAFINNCKF